MQTIRKTVTTENEGIRLDAFLAQECGETRSRVQNLIEQGCVKVNGAPAKDPGQQVDETTAQLTVNGAALDGRLTRHVMLHKPAGLLTAARDKKQPTVMDLLPDVYSAIGCMPVGRLDKDTTGLLFLTTDGELNHRLLSPGRHVDKTYLAEVDVLNARIRELMDIAKSTGGCTLDNRSRLKQWQSEWRMSNALIELAAEYARGTAKPMQYMHKLLSIWHDENIANVEEARSAHERHLASLTQKPASAPAASGQKRVIEQQYSQRAYDPADVDGLTPEQIEEMTNL